MIRFLIIAILLFLYLVLGIPVLLVEKLRAKKDQEASDYRCLRLVQWMFRVMLRVAGVQVTVIGEENIPDEPVLFIGNHRSYFDILLTYSRCRTADRLYRQKGNAALPPSPGLDEPALLPVP